MARIAVYCRVSTHEQTVAPQLDMLREYARARSFEITDEYIDNGVSGSRASRPALDRLLDDARRRRFDAVACVKLDRLARSVRHLTNLVAEFEALGIDFIVLDQGIDTTSAVGRFLFHTLAAVAEFERDLIQERTRAGVEAARRRGKRIGRPRALDNAKRKRLQRLRAHGHSTYSIAKMLDIGQTTVVREIKRLQQVAAHR